LSFFQNSVSFGRSFRKTGFRAGFSFKSKEAFPTTEVLEKPQLFHVKHSGAAKKQPLFIRKSGLIPRSSAPAETTQNIRNTGIKPDGIINFLTNEPPFQYNPTLKIPQGSALRRLI